MDVAASVKLFRGFYGAIRFALPERRAVLLIVALTLITAAANAAEALVLKVTFDGLASRPRSHTRGVSRCGLHRLSRFAEEVLQLRQLFLDGRMVRVG